MKNSSSSFDHLHAVLFVKAPSLFFFFNIYYVRFFDTGIERRRTEWFLFCDTKLRRYSNLSFWISLDSRIISRELSRLEQLDLDFQMAIWRTILPIMSSWCSCFVSNLESCFLRSMIEVASPLWVVIKLASSWNFLTFCPYNSLECFFEWEISSRKPCSYWMFFDVYPF